MARFKGTCKKAAEGFRYYKTVNGEILEQAMSEERLPDESKGVNLHMHLEPSLPHAHCRLVTHPTIEGQLSQ